MGCGYSRSYSRPSYTPQGTRYAEFQSEEWFIIVMGLLCLIIGLIMGYYPMNTNRQNNQEKEDEPRTVEDAVNKRKKN